MATLSQIEAHRRAIDDLTALAVRDLVALWQTLTLDDAVEASKQVQALLPLIIDGYGTAAATLSADWYDELREQASAPGRYVAKAVDVAPEGQVAALARWGVSPLFGAEPDPAKALSLVAGGMQRLLANVDRQSVEVNSEADPGRPLYARHASANACAFCKLLATRSAVYGSAKAATEVVGRGTEKKHDGSHHDRLRLGVGKRGSRDLGSKYHDNCHCTAVPVWPGQEIVRAPYVDQWEKAYIEASRKNATKGDNGAIDLKATLAEMRQILGSS